MSKYKLTLFAKIFLFVIALLIIFGVTYILSIYKPDIIPEPIAKILKIEREENILTNLNL